MVATGEYADRILDAHFNGETPHETFRDILDSYDDAGMALPGTVLHGKDRQNVEYIQAASEEYAAENRSEAQMYAELDRDASELLDERQRSGRLLSFVKDVTAGAGTAVGTDFAGLDQAVADATAQYGPEVAGTADFIDWSLAAGLSAYVGAKYLRLHQHGSLELAEVAPEHREAQKLLHFRLHDHYDE